MSIIYIKVLQKENLLDFEVLTFVIHIFPTSTFHVPAAYSLFKMMNKSANGRPHADRVILIFEKETNHRTRLIIIQIYVI